ncbi:hypothetical protein D3C86_1244740 [compost metagenome]
MWIAAATKDEDGSLFDGFLAKMFEVPPEELRKRVKALKFSSPADVDAWAASEKEGELALRFALVTHSVVDDVTKRLAETWLLTQEQARTDSRAQEALVAAQRSAAASERSARWTLFAAVVAAIGTIVTATGIIVPLIWSHAQAGSTAPPANLPHITKPPQ